MEEILYSGDILRSPVFSFGIDAKGMQKESYFAVILKPAKKAIFELVLWIKRCFNDSNYPCYRIFM
jgi:hypothetical protein